MGVSAPAFNFKYGDNISFPVKFLHRFLTQEKSMPQTKEQAVLQIVNAVKEHPTRSFFLMTSLFVPVPGAREVAMCVADFSHIPDPPANKTKPAANAAPATPKPQQQAAATPAAPKPQAVPAHFASLNPGSADPIKHKTHHHKTHESAKNKPHEKLSYGLA